VGRAKYIEEEKQRNTEIDTKEKFTKESQAEDHGVEKDDVMRVVVKHGKNLLDGTIRRGKPPLRNNKLEGKKLGVKCRIRGKQDLLQRV